jgi:hypothetical protein
LKSTFFSEWFLTLALVTELFLSYLGPTLFFGSVLAAKGGATAYEKEDGDRRHNVRVR